MGVEVGEDVVVERLPHGYTNATRKVAGRVEKTYEGPARHTDAAREVACLSALRDRLPVATILDYDLTLPRLTLSLISGDQGQDLVERGHAPKVLRLVGATLRALQAVPPSAVAALVGSGSVIVHGDFGPQNMLFDLDENRVTGVVDWEWAHVGDPVEDLAWAEWLVRMHHPEAVGALDALFDGAQQRPAWNVRHAAMLRRVRELLSSCEVTHQSSEWKDRLERTERWSAA